MSDNKSLYSSASQGISGLMSAGVGFAQRRAANKMLKKLGDSPNMEVPDEVLQNKKMAELNASIGMPQEQYNQAMKNIHRNQMAALRGSANRRGGLAILAATQQGANDATLNLDVADAKARMQNQNTLYGVNSNLANWKNRAWQNNVLDKWNRKYQYGMSMLGSGNQNLTSGLNQIASAGLSYANSRTGRNGSENLLATDESNYD